MPFHFLIHLLKSALSNGIQKLQNNHATLLTLISNRHACMRAPALQLLYFNSKTTTKIPPKWNKLRLPCYLSSIRLSHMLFMSQAVYKFLSHLKNLALDHLSSFQPWQEIQSVIIIIEDNDSTYVVFEKANQNNSELGMRLTRQNLCQFFKNLKPEFRVYQSQMDKGHFIIWREQNIFDFLKYDICL